MRLSDLVLTCVFILCCAGLTQRDCARLRISTGSLAAACLLLLALSNIRLPIGVSAHLDPALFAAAGWALFFCRREDRLGACALLSLLCGAAARALMAAFPDAAEMGVLLALPSALAAWTFMREPRRALLVTQLAPLALALLIALENGYLFGSLLLSAGAAARFDAQAFGAVMLAVLWRIRMPKAVSRPAA